ncbi:MAG: hypothetical protein KBT48_03360 [Firmicutes bacterium]|nr:hypothetical protein [Bacillota bacterium]
MRIFVLKDQAVSEVFESLYIPFIEVKEETVIPKLEDCDVVFVYDNISFVKRIESLPIRINIIYISDSTRDCLEAYKHHVSGYLKIPFTEKDVQEELEHLRYGEWSCAKIKCFGNFDVMLDGKSISFPRRRAKEILAYLVFRNGELVSVDEISEVIFNEVTEKTRKYIYVLKFEAVKSLVDKGLNDVIIVQGNKFRVNVNAFDCDFYKYLTGETSLYKGEFMKPYPWAKTKLEELLEKRVK